MIISKKLRKVVKCSNDIAPLLQKLHQEHCDELDRGKEKFFVIHLDIGNRINAIESVTVGTLSSCPVHPREVFRRAIYLNTAKIIIAHNHPSGDVEPSQNDILITQGLIVAGKCVGIDIVEHIIFSDDDWYSFNDEGLI